MVRPGPLALDGTKLRANASRREAMSYARMSEKEKILAQEVCALLAETERIDRPRTHGSARTAAATRCWTSARTPGSSCSVSASQARNEVHLDQPERSPSSRAARGEAPRHGDETEPDAWFTFANERTFLAWNRTALALVGAGLAIIQLLPPSPACLGRHLLAVPLIALGAVLSLAGYVEWTRKQRALRRGERLPHSPLPRVLAAFVTAIAAAAALAVLAPDPDADERARSVRPALAS